MGKRTGDINNIEHKEVVMSMTLEQYEEFIAAQKDAGLKIDPETAETTWWYAQTLDPYGVLGDLLPGELRQVERQYFARAPGSDNWVSFDNLPKNTRDALWNRDERELAVPAGLAPTPSEEPMGKRSDFDSVPNDFYLTRARRCCR